MNVILNIKIKRRNGETNGNTIKERRKKPKRKGALPFNSHTRPDVCVKGGRSDTTHAINKYYKIREQQWYGGVR